MSNLLETVAQLGSFGTLLNTIELTEITDMLDSPGPFTILAPTDEAFNSLPPDTLDSLKQHPMKLKQVMLYHVLYGDVRSDDLAQIEEAPTVEGSIVAVEQGESVKINDIEVIRTDILADNGVIHVLNGVLMPTILSPE
jgi:uncharacterized surface protein with fasciclin (FAS1) repeats